jgi:hypothetical protein
VDGSYKEFNNYIGYKNKHLTLELWDIYNFSPGATYNNKEFFNYSAKQTGRFWDMRSYYTISDRFPLVLSWNTVVLGETVIVKIRRINIPHLFPENIPSIKKMTLKCVEE